MTDELREHSGDEFRSEEPHLVDLSSILNVAEWIVLAMASGLIGHVTVEGAKLASGKIRDVLKRWRNEKGRSQVIELKMLVIERVKLRAATEPIDLPLATQQIDEVFSDFE